MSEAARQREAACAFKATGVPPRLAQVTLKSFAAVAGEEPAKRDAMNAALEFYRNGCVVGAGGMKKRSILIWGGCGIGKTGVLVPLFNYLTGQKHMSGLFLSFQALVEQIEAGYADKSAYDKLEQARSVDVLFLDDLGYSYRNEASAHAVKVVSSVIMHRHGGDAVTLFTSNLAPDELEVQFGAPNWQRIGEMARVIEMGGRVLRQIG